jgi:hypothetical protein
MFCDLNCRRTYRACGAYNQNRKIVPFFTVLNKSKEKTASFSSSVREMYLDIKSNSKSCILFFLLKDVTLATNVWRLGAVANFGVFYCHPRTNVDKSNALD